MSVRALLADLKRRDVSLAAEGGRLVVDAPTGTVTDELRASLAENKPGLLKLLEWERRKLEEADSRGLLIRWSEYPDWIELHDPTTGERVEVKASECLPGVVNTANANRRKGGAP